MNKIIVGFVIYVILAIIGWYSVRKERQLMGRPMDWSDEILAVTVALWIGPVYAIPQIFKWIARSFDK